MFLLFYIKHPWRVKSHVSIFHVTDERKYLLLFDFNLFPSTALCQSCHLKQHIVEPCMSACGSNLYQPPDGLVDCSFVIESVVATTRKLQPQISGCTGSDVAFHPWSCMVVNFQALCTVIFPIIPIQPSLHTYISKHICSWNCGLQLDPQTHS